MDALISIITKLTIYLNILILKYYLNEQNLVYPK